MITIAIDGPSAAGKTGTAKRLSQKLNILHLNTGALYRAIAYYLYEHNIDAENEEAVNAVLSKIEINVKFKDGSQNTYVNGMDVSDKLYTSEMGHMSSVSSAYPKVREKMLHLQRQIAKEHSVVMEGRDITSVVLPNAKNKFFLTASVEVRAKRRLKNLQDLGENISYEQVLEDLKERDLRDSTRENNPLTLVDDAVLIETDNLTLNQVVDKILGMIKE